MSVQISADGKHVSQLRNVPKLLKRQKFCKSSAEKGQRFDFILEKNELVVTAERERGLTGGQRQGNNAFFCMREEREG